MNAYSLPDHYHNKYLSPFSPSTDVDECARGLDLCQGEAECRDTDGAYECICGEGLTVSEDGLSCVGKPIALL